MSVKTKIQALTKRLYPKGRVFHIKNGSRIDRLHNAISLSEKKAHNDALSILDSILPDNNNFTTEDATRWEQRLGLIVSPNVPLADRKLAIARKMNHPGDIPARQSADYLEGQLRDAGFDVYVYRYNGQTPNQILSANSIGDIAQHATDIYHQQTGMFHGDPNSGVLFQNCIANYIDEDKDQFFDVGTNNYFTFIISSSVIETFADIDINRKDEFRQLILKIKPVNSVGFLFVNYV